MSPNPTFGRGRLERRLPPAVWVWKKFIKTMVRIYPNGVCRFGLVHRGRPDNVTYTLLKLKPEELEMLRDERGRLREPWLSRLAFFMADVKNGEGLSEFELVTAGLYELILYSRERNYKKISFEVAPNVRLRLSRNRRVD